MKVLHLASWYPDRTDQYNGDFVQRHLQAIALYLPVTLIHFAQSGITNDTQETLYEVRSTTNLTELICQFRFQRTGIRFIDRIRYNLRYYKLFRKRIRQYFNENGLPDIVHLHVPMKAGPLAIWIKDEFNIPFILSEHSSSYFNNIPDNYESRNFYYKKAVSSIFQNALRVTTVSQQIGSQLQRLFDLPSLTIIPNVVDTSKFFFSGSTPEKFRFIHASTMNHPKNVEGILRVLAALNKTHKNWDCIMLGWDTQALKLLSANLELDDIVQWKGVVDHLVVATEMQQSSALLMFSRYENLPCTILEALCCGLPVIATDVGGISEAVNVNNGLLVVSEDEAALLAAMKQMLDNYSVFDHHQIAKDAAEKYNCQQVGNQFVSLYQQLLKEKD